VKDFTKIGGFGVWCMVVCVFGLFHQTPNARASRNKTPNNKTPLVNGSLYQKRTIYTTMIRDSLIK
jgi:hypothetical protein